MTDDEILKESELLTVGEKVELEAYLLNSIDSSDDRRAIHLLARKLTVKKLRS